MARNTREELIKKYSCLFDWKKCSQFYALPHEEKSKKEVFESFCKAYNGTLAIVLSDDEICDNKELVLIAAKYGLWAHLELLSERLLNDPDIAVALANCNLYEYSKVSKKLRDDPRLMLKVIKVDPTKYRRLPVSVKINRDILLEIAEHSPHSLEMLLKIRKADKDRIFSDKELALIVANSDPNELIYFDESVLKDEDVLSLVFCINDPAEMKNRLLKYPWGLKYLDQKLWIDDRTLVIKAVKIDGSIYHYLPERYKNDRKVALLAVKNCPEVLEFCPDQFKDDAQIVKAALQDGTEYMLSYASDRLKDDYNVVLKAVKMDALNLEFASDRLRDDRNIVLNAIKVYGGVLEDASERLQKDEELIKIAEENL